MKLGRVGFDETELRIEVQTHFDVHPKQTVEHLAGLSDRFIQAELLDRQNLIAAEGEKRTRQSRGTFASLLDRP